MKKRLLLAAFICIGGSFAASISNADELTTEKEKDIRSLLQYNGAVTQTKDAFVQSMNSVDILSQCKQCPPNSKEVLTRVSAKVVSQNISAPGGLVDRLVPIYNAHFTHQEVLDWLTFVRSPIGQKVIAAQPLLYKEISPASNAWIKSLLPEIYRKVDTELGIKR
jgi:hypothetical protein